ncbi:MAG: RnfABCDGE type electron transport complex subunit D [Sphaerochaetaceae bacterium]|nr:RnfABCDGE type electron transport complex subunit D [Sphaerochaetaceae bacterium]
MSTSKIMWNVSLALLPAAMWGVYVFGFRALLIILISIASSVGFEYLLLKISKDASVQDGSAFLTGLLIGMNLPSGSSFIIPVLASAFAIFVVKWTFGGLGANWMNPALAGRVFVFFSFTNLMNTYPIPRTLISSTGDSVASATYLSSVKMAMSDQVLTQASGSQVLSHLGTATTGFAQQVSGLFASMGINLSPYTVDAFFGNISGSLGEVSAFLLLLGGIYMLVRKIITWHIPVSFLGSFILLAWAFGGLRNGNGLFSGEVLLPVFSGGLMLGAIFMATDMVTSPVTYRGMILYGVLIGFFTFLIRYYGSLPESVSLAIILVNIFVPAIDRYVKPRKFGEVIPPVKEKKEERA